MTFRLEKSTTSNRALTKFSVLNADGDIIGSINVKPSEEADLRAQWRDVAPQAATNKAAAANSRKEISVMAAAMQKKRGVNQQAILRGC